MKKRIGFQIIVVLGLAGGTVLSFFIAYVEKTVGNMSSFIGWTVAFILFLSLFLNKFERLYGLLNRMCKQKNEK